MCRGIHQQNSSLPVSQGCAAGNDFVSCELCRSRATLYCQADDAYLCSKCDRNVHGANFLALRHVRCFLCNSCQNLTNRYLIRASREVLLRVPPLTVSGRPEEERTRPQCDLEDQKDCSSTTKIPFQFL